MTFHDRLIAETAVARTEFLSIPILRRALDGNVPRALYLEFLGQAYHHVCHTCPLMALAARRTRDRDYWAALHAYIHEERGHEQWILADIAVLGGDADRVMRAAPRPPCRAMIAYAYYAVEWISPYALLGMVHVLEGMSVLLAGRAAAALRKGLGARGGGGFRYLDSHGALDVEHVEFFRELVNTLPEPLSGDVIVDCANVMYWLYGNIFRELGRVPCEDAHAA